MAEFARQLGEIESSLSMLPPGEIDAAVDSLCTGSILFRRSQRELWESRERYHRLVNSMAAIVFELEPDGTALFVNSAVENLTGSGPEAIIGKNWWKAVGLADVETARLCEQFQRDDVRSYALTLAPRGNKTTVLELNSANEYGADGTLKRIVCVALDVTQRCQSESALRASEHEFRMIAENVPALFAYIAADGRYRFVNKQLEQWLGRPREELLGAHYQDVLADPNFERIRVRIAAALEGRGLRFEETITFPHGNRSVSGEYVPDLDNGRLKGIFALVCDVSEQRRTEAALRESEKLLRTVLDTLPVGVWFTDSQGGIISGNPAAQSIWGETDMAGVNENSLYKGWWADTGKPIAPEEWAAARALAQGETSLNEVIEIERLDGQRKIILNSATPLRDEAGCVQGALIVNQDITERKHLEEQLRQVQKMEAIGRLAGGIAHDFNNMLTVINGYTDLALIQIGPGNPLRELIEPIRDAAARSSQLTRQLLTFSRQQIVQPEILDLAVVTFDLQKMLARLIGEDINFTIEAAEGGCFVEADRGQIEQILMNLVVNSRDAMPRGGELRVEIRHVDLERPLAGKPADVPPGSYVLLRVSDTGCGMDAAVRSRVFEPFFTTKAKGKGTGLGLASVYGIVKQSQGEILVDSEPGRGATFRLFFPRARPEGRRTVRPQSRGRRDGTETLLLVEDDGAVRRLTRGMLEEFGYHVIDAACGSDALAACGESAGPIHLLLTDVIMPGMSGPELAGQLTALRPEMKVLYMSGYTDDAIGHYGVLDRETAYLQKPFSARALAEKLRELLDEETES